MIALLDRNVGGAPRGLHFEPLQRAVEFSAGGCGEFDEGWGW